MFCKKVDRHLPNKFYCLDFIESGTQFNLINTEKHCYCFTHQT